MLEDGSQDLSTKAYYIEDSSCCFTNSSENKFLCCRCMHTRRASPLTCLAICFLVLSYNLLGGFLFLAIEGNIHTEETAVAASKLNLSDIEASIDLRSKTVEKLWSITEDLNILYKENWTKLAAKELMLFQKVLLKSARRELLVEKSGYSNDHNIEYKWTFSSSFLYALTLITTIGYGNVTPKTSIGKIVAIVYACIGIPIVMLYLSTMGEAFARNFRIFYSKICPSRFKSDNFHKKSECMLKYSSIRNKNEKQRRYKFSEVKTQTPFQAALNLDSLNSGYHWTCQNHTRVPIIISLLLIVLYIVLGTFIFFKTEDWNTIDSCFFSFSSIATIGFGDLRPGQKSSFISAKSEDIALGICCLYILVGIVVVAMCFNLIQEDTASLLRGFTALCISGTKPRAVHSTDNICEDLISLSVAS